jgi:hypothetical protein
MEAKTPKEFFEKVLPARFDSSKAAGVDAVVQLTLLEIMGEIGILSLKTRN